MNANTQKSGMAVTSLVLGVLSLVCFGLFAGIPAIILGHIAYHRARKSPEQYGGAGLAITGFVMGYVSFVTTLLLAAMLLPALARAKSRAQSIQCVNNLKQIGMAFHIWEGDHQKQFPFNVSTNQGGTMEFCRWGDDGFDQNAVRHFQVLSNELVTPKTLVCAADSARHAALTFQDLQPANVTYQLRSGTNIADMFPQEILARCPIHGNVLRGDGSVERGSRR